MLEDCHIGLARVSHRFRVWLLDYSIVSRTWHGTVGTQPIDVSLTVNRPREGYDVTVDSKKSSNGHSNHSRTEARIDNSLRDCDSTVTKIRECIRTTRIWRQTAGR